MNLRPRRACCVEGRPIREMQDVDPRFSLSFLPERADHFKTERDVNLSFSGYVLQVFQSAVQMKYYA